MCCQTFFRCPRSKYCGSCGYCLNNPDLKTSVPCIGTCIAKLALGADCSKKAMNIHEADPSKLLVSGDDNACQSGKCNCGSCLNSGSKVANGGKWESLIPLQFFLLNLWPTSQKILVKPYFRCSGNPDCSSGYCMGWSTIACQGTCRPKAKEGESCSASAAKGFVAEFATSAANEYCETKHCICDYCANIHGRLKKGQKYATDDNCDGSMVCDEPWDNQIGCKGHCADYRAGKCLSQLHDWYHFTSDKCGGSGSHNDKVKVAACFQPDHSRPGHYTTTDTWLHEGDGLKEIQGCKISHSIV